VATLEETEAWTGAWTEAGIELSAACDVETLEKTEAWTEARTEARIELSAACDVATLEETEARREARREARTGTTRMEGARSHGSCRRTRRNKRAAVSAHTTFGAG
jgi:hypothetical protein